MQEDEIGLQKALGRTTYVQCSRCGKSIPEREAIAAPADALENGMEYDLLCPSCRDELADGEQDLPVTTE
jgi:ribosomal protein S26